MIDLQRYAVLLVITLLALSVTPVYADAPVSSSSSVGFSASEGTAVYAGEVFQDTNFNGIREFSENEMPEILVTLETLEGAILQEVESDTFGYYVFDDLPEGQFRIRIWPPKGYHVTINGAYTINTHEPQATVVQSTGLFLGIFLPSIQG